MNWTEAQQELEDGNAVARAAWPDDRYVDAEFMPGMRPRFVLYTDSGSSEATGYYPTDDDQFAKDWQLA